MAFLAHLYHQDNVRDDLLKKGGQARMTTLRSVLIFCLMIFTFAGVGCKKNAPDTPAVQTAPDKTESLQEKVDRLQRDLFQIKMQVRQMSGGSADVSTEEKGYSIAQTKYGSFAVACKNVTPYLDGYKVQLNIGNLTSVKFNGAKISLLWGTEYNHNKEMSVTNSFFPGRFTTVEIVMTPAKPEDIKTFSVILDFDQMALL